MESFFTADNAPYLWVAFGAAMLAIEAFGLPGIGFLFAGLGAITAGILIEMGVMGTGNTTGQFAWFFGSTVAWTALLWKPMQRFRTRKATAGDYNNMVGNTATVSGGPLEKGKAGKVHWSGTTMQAELADDTAQDGVPEGTDVVIREVKGTRLIVELKN